jgi:hypothetical protein
MAQWTLRGGKFRAELAWQTIKPAYAARLPFGQ